MSACMQYTAEDDEYDEFDEDGMVEDIPEGNDSDEDDDSAVEDVSDNKHATEVKCSCLSIDFPKAFTSLCSPCT